MGVVVVEIAADTTLRVTLPASWDPAAASTRAKVLKAAVKAANKKRPAQAALALEACRLVRGDGAAIAGALPSFARLDATPRTATPRTATPRTTTRPPPLPDDPERDDEASLLALRRARRRAVLAAAPRHQSVKAADGDAAADAGEEDVREPGT
ncbi:peptide-aspartate beta-dioxygenase [Aureococcus anophagefferens]|uniref:Peptide-aspartate beta-dioxygenase n=1 Tax=Aureococcus anophagefferens TaxID=44056 RepID=A0ABR1GCB9_AURAN